MGIQDRDYYWEDRARRESEAQRPPQPPERPKREQPKPTTSGLFTLIVYSLAAYGFVALARDLAALLAHYR